MQLRTIAASTPASLAVGAKGFGYLFQGKGSRPTRIDLTNGVATDMGIDPPPTKPGIAMSGVPTRYIARIDVVEGGQWYTTAPKITISGGDPVREAKARGYLTGVAVGDVSVLDYGCGYKTTPTVTVEPDTLPTPAKLTAVLDGGPTGGGVVSSVPTGLGKYDVSSNPNPHLCLPARIISGGSYQLLYVPGSGNITQEFWRNVPDAAGNEWTYDPSFDNTKMTFRVRVAQGTARATVVLTFGVRYASYGSVNIIYPFGAPQKIEIQDPGEGYVKDETYSIYALGTKTAPSAQNGITGEGTGTPLVITFLSNESDGGLLGAESSFPIKSVTVDDGGANYTIPPTIEVDDAYGSGAILEPVLENGKIKSVTVVKGGVYTKAPTLRISAGGAKAVAITRPHIRGKIDCYYRYVDDTPESRGGPICSSLSPVNTIDAGNGVGQLQWTVAAPPAVDGRTLKVELWRTTSDQAYTVYRVKSGVTSFVDTLSDADLTDYERDEYAAMAILLPNGELNANRFGVPPSDKAVAVMFQDRLWMAVDSSGDGPNALRFSEYNEPESCPDINELVLQTNVKGHDHITALVPYGASLGVMQTRHSYRLSYVSQPIIDANLQVAAYRGCLNQRCWDEFEGLVYCMDAEGVYAMDQGGQVKPLSMGLRDVFDNRINFAQSDWFSVTADRKARCLRVAVRLVEDGPGKYPTRLFCYSFDAEGWWEERYPSPLVGSASVRDAAGVSRCVYGSTEGRIFAVNSGRRDIATGTIAAVTLTNPGTGYTKPPKVTVVGDGFGAVIDSAVGTDGRLLGLYIRNGGFGYTSATVRIEAPTSGTTATATCTRADGPVDIPCWFKSGNMEYPHDSLPVEQTDKNRNVALLFTPTDGPCKMKLRMYYNNSPHPRINVAARDRGTGVVYETQEPAVTLDMDAGLLPDRISSGVCRALFSSHTVDDIQGNDRHVAFELYARSGVAGPVEVHSVDVFGVAGG